MSAGASFGRRVVTGVAWGQGGQLVAFGMATLVQIILARALGTDDFGLYAAVNGAVYLMIALTTGGATGTLNAQLTQMLHRHGRDAAAFLFWRILLWRLLIFAAVALVFVAFAEPIAAAFLGDADRSGLLLAAVVYLVTVGLFQIVNMVFFGLLKTKWGAIGNALSASVNVGVAGTLMSLDATITELFMGLAAGQMLVAVWQLAVAWSDIRPSRAVRRLGDEPRRDVHRLWRFSVTVWGTTIVTFALGRQTDLFTMQLFRTESDEIGFYSLAATLVWTASTIMLLGIGQVALAGLSSVHARDPARLGKAWRTLCSVAPMLSVPMLVFVGVFAEPIISSVYGGDYGDAAILLQVLAGLAVIGAVLGGGAHTTAFAAMGKPRRTLQARGLTGVLNVAANCALIPFYGAMGAVIGTGCAGALTILYEYRLLCRELSERLPWSDYLRGAIALLPGLVPAWFLAPHLGILGVLLAGASYLGIYFAMLTVVRPITLDPRLRDSVPRIAHRVMRFEEVPTRLVTTRESEPAHPLIGDRPVR